MAVKYLDKRIEVKGLARPATTTQIAEQLTRNFARMKELQEELQKLAHETAVMNEQLVKAVIRNGD